MDSDSDYDDLDSEDEESLRQNLRDHRAAKAKGVRLSSRAEAKDVAAVVEHVNTTVSYLLYT